MHVNGLTFSNPVAGGNFEIFPAVRARLFVVFCFFIIIFFFSFFIFAFFFSCSALLINNQQFM